MEDFTPDQLVQLTHLRSQRRQVELLQQLADKKPMSFQAAEKLLSEIKSELASLKDKKPPTVSVNVDPANLAQTMQKALEVSSKALTEAISRIKPIINVDSPKVTVKPTDVNIDLTPVIEAIRAAKTKIPPFPDTIKSDNSAIYVEGKTLEPLHASVNFIERGVVDIVEGVKGRRIRVISALLMANGHVDIVFKSGDTDISGSLPLRPYAGFVLPKNEYGWLETEVGQPLSIQSNSYTSVGGMITCIII